jgi:hypothetical protein
LPAIVNGFFSGGPEQLQDRYVDFSGTFQVQWHILSGGQPFEQQSLQFRRRGDANVAIQADETASFILFDRYRQNTAPLAQFFKTLRPHVISRPHHTWHLPRLASQRKYGGSAGWPVAIPPSDGSKSLIGRRPHNQNLYGAGFF